ncbi:hypothetical protein E2C01_011512 [Portunus trituberculatus]|uniref:Uncharacterized protein n=1 Tax=Portunus trituberculatus TaxID=210409 RepID=A0A5B7DBA6_PORTR|nr:hypothetical protein [Portunus trituberculatus]
MTLSSTPSLSGTRQTLFINIPDNAPQEINHTLFFSDQVRVDSGVSDGTRSGGRIVRWCCEKVFCEERE